ncbi:MAG: glycosyltransferase family 4 protein [Candidatus Berkelbacteria bacterium]|nr:glycosyltransferase family 4 protein [Candidatus Berkelbacteria bacterium]
MKKILAITQCFPCGSWLCIEKILQKLESQNYKVRVLGLGTPSERLGKFKYNSIPFLAYTRFGNITCMSPIFGLLWYLPLYFSAVFLVLIHWPKTIVYNGLTSGLVLSPLFKLLGRKNIIMYHSIIGTPGATTAAILKLLFRPVDMVVVNSVGSLNDLSQVVSKKKLVVNEHYAASVFFDLPAKKIKPHKSLNVLYAGRIDKDKRCFPLIDFAKKMKNNTNFSFTFVGSGADVNKVVNLPKTHKQIKYGGYVNNKQDLAKLYSEADVVWGFADTTYLALPAVEALASGTPIVVPKYAAITGKDELVNPELVPKSTGWLVDPFDPEEIKEVMFRIQEKKEYIGKKPREFAKEYYSDNNLLSTVKKIEKLTAPKK